MADKAQKPTAQVVIDYDRAADKGAELLDMLPPDEQRIVLRHRFERAAAAFAAKPGSVEWADLINHACAYQRGRNP
jgi:hypothetical protein